MAPGRPALGPHLRPQVRRGGVRPRGSATPAAGRPAVAGSRCHPSRIRRRVVATARGARSGGAHPGRLRRPARSPHPSAPRRLPAARAHAARSEPLPRGAADRRRRAADRAQGARRPAVDAHGRVQEERIDSNPVAKIRKPSQAPSRSVDPIAPAVVERLRVQLTLADATLVSVLAYAGLRPARPSPCGGAGSEPARSAWSAPRRSARRS